MGKVVVFIEPRTLGFTEYEDRPLAANEVRLQTLYSGISAGTELTAYRGSNPRFYKHWDDKARLFATAEEASIKYPISGWGYEECGKVVELGIEVTSVKVGDVIYGTWGHRTHHIVTEDYASKRVLFANLDPILGIFSQMGAISLNGILDAAIRISETVAVFGMGAPGQIVAQLAKKSGARVIGVDLIDMRLEVAQKLGAIDVAINSCKGNVADQIKAMTDNRGADVSIEVTGSYSALHEAIRSTAYSAKVVALGFFLETGEGLCLGEEFHHNRINIVCSQIYGVGPELTYRWNEERLVHSAMRLQSEGVLNLLPIITHVYPFNEAAEAFRMCDAESEKTIQVALDFTK
jgi:2-desacetyl-2-hydroxyethyl bacteriochlorophyllide A dehydrogenase